MDLMIKVFLISIYQIHVSIQDIVYPFQYPLMSIPHLSVTLITCPFFNVLGQRYNQDGILTPWWTDQSVKAFNERKACFVNQYSEYSVFGYPVRD